VLKELVSKA